MSTTEAQLTIAVPNPDDDQDEVCHRCGKHEWYQYPSCLQVQPCDKCERPVCGNCAEVDYDGTEDGYTCCWWACDSLEGGCADGR